MRLAARLALLLLVVSAGEIVLLVVIARQIGPALTLGLVVATSVLGAVLLRREGSRGWRRFRAALAERRPPGVEATDGLVGLVAALLLFMPGFVTDAIGLLLLVAPVRAVAGAALRRRAERRISPAAATDLFGPKRVQRMPTPDPAPGTGTAGTDAGGDGAPVEAEIVEGEIIDPDRRR